MIDLTGINTIFFDYDGTLHDSMRVYAPAFRKAYAYLVKKGLAENRPISDKEISYWLGFNSQEMWKSFMPNLPEETREYCSQIIGAEMRRLIELGNAVLYDGAIETLKYLKDKGYCLIFISNCKIYYRDVHNKAFNLDKYFNCLVCSEEYDFIPKHEILKFIMEQYPKKMAIVGDRAQDIEAGIKNNIFAIGCNYGFATEGELQKAHLIINDIQDLKQYF